MAELTAKQETARRLMAYSAAAGLGAFGATQNAEAVIIHVDIPDVTIVEGQDFEIDMNGGIYADIKFQNITTGPSYTRFRIRGQYGSLDLSNLAKGSTYYVRSFEAGDVIGNNAITGVAGGGHVAKQDTTNFGNLVAPQFAGLLLKDEGTGDQHWAWVRVSWDDVNNTATIYEYAYESDLFTQSSIVAGATPEPATLGLLAAGLGAMGLRRRQA